MSRQIIAEPIKTTRLSEIIETHIRGLILDGEISPGERLPTEKEISRQFGVSVITAREAIKGLEVSGLIERRKGRSGGSFGRMLGTDTLKVPLNNLLSLKKISSDNLTEFRLIIEPATARIAANRISADEIKTLEKNVRHCEATSDKWDETVVDERKQKNIEFHLLIAEATKNPVLALMVDLFMDVLFESKIKAFRPDPRFTSDTIGDHRRILTRLKARNGELAQREMILHLERIERYFVQNRI
jgi:GntR family transcriptional repressor for pyruvate dehydrogenase complex